MDNAKYHKGLPLDTLKYGNKKSVLQDACTVYGISFTNEMKAALCKKLSVHVSKIDIEVVSLARAAGHEVVYTPPYHSDLQLIEIVWAIVKCQDGRQYTQVTTFKDVRVQLMKSFEDLTPSSIKGCIHKTDMQLNKLAAYNKEQHEGDASDSDSSSSSNDSIER
ncbi:hypothetical protein AaE_006544 [Aphanomyces astaci]|uniref:Tc1-like transposase DDE domain-containing protein n=1 Tax=Aphanomyces astaci TaxID=112090 RepID=A0A6A5AD47_APHAT|nr:hypothetical protein AaE_006544 [Aphanomyces astaci]